MYLIFNIYIQNCSKKAEIYVCSAVKNNSVKKSDVTDFTQIVNFCYALP